MPKDIIEITDLVAVFRMLEGWKGVSGNCFIESGANERGSRLIVAVEIGRLRDQKGNNDIDFPHHPEG